MLSLYNPSLYNPAIVWNHPPTNLGQLCLYCGLVFPQSHHDIITNPAPVFLYFFEYFFGCTCYRRLQHWLGSEVHAVKVVAAADTDMNLSSVHYSLFSVWLLKQCHQQDELWGLPLIFCLTTFFLMDSLSKSHWRDVTTRRRSTKPSTGSNRDPSDASRGWGEMILIVALPQPSS